MRCVWCRSFKQVELTAEMLIHIPGLKNLDKAPLWLFPKLLVCLDCGRSHFTVPRTELGSIAKNTLANKSFALQKNGRMLGDVTVRCDAASQTKK
jgi:hypothetical protein